MTVRDPVCGMEINPESASTKREYMGQTFYFCSRSCADLFDKDPHRYMTTSATTGFNPEKPLERIELPLSASPSTGRSPQLESSLRALPGVGEVKVNLAANRLEVEYDAGQVDLARIVQTVKDAGHQVGAQTRI
ncbi:MAG TPA: YHS domain-containing protein, partial [Anaerolineales bacterium]|nr:YHS domain-containing protein [Anaerolineales bacterium]